MANSILPRPQRLTPTTGSFELVGEITLSGPWTPFNRSLLTGILSKHTGLMQVDNAGRTLSCALDGRLAEEAYNLHVSEAGIHLVSANGKGQFYAIGTLLQLVSGTDRIDGMEIKDAPRYGYRGVLLDVSRHFIPKEELLRYIEIAALNKLNRLHLHLTDDQGWRVEIRKYHRLTEIGANRTGSPDKAYDEATSDYRNCGYYSQDDLREIIGVASDRNIEIVPEIDMPGHFTAAAAAFPELLCEPGGTTVTTKAGIFGEILCIGNEAHDTFVFDILDEIIDLFPCDTLHLGGDEVFKIHWIHCEKCMEAARRYGLDSPRQMQTWFMNKVVGHAKKRGKKVVLWNDAFSDDALDKTVACEYWHPYGNLPALQDILRNNGIPVIDANIAAYYFDYPISSLSLRKVYQYESVFEGASCVLLGLEMALWTEWVHSRKIANDLLFPRLFAFAETAWSPGEKKDYTDFKRRVLQNEPLYEEYGISLDNKGKWDYRPLLQWLARMIHTKKFVTLPMIRMFLANMRINRMKFKEP